MAEDIVRVLRMVEFVGPRSWVEEQVSRSLHGTRIVHVHPMCSIRTATVGDYPEILDGIPGDLQGRPVTEDYQGNPGQRAREQGVGVEPTVDEGLPEAQEPPVMPEQASEAATKTAAPITVVPLETINPDGSPCEGCGNTFIHAFVTDTDGDLKACPRSPEDQQATAPPRLTLEDL